MTAGAPPDKAVSEELVNLRGDFNLSAVDWICASLDAWIDGDLARAERCLALAHTARHAALRVPLT